jgi:hypothetical protein
VIEPSLREHPKAQTPVEVLLSLETKVQTEKIVGKLNSSYSSLSIFESLLLMYNEGVWDSSSRRFFVEDDWI